MTRVPTIALLFFNISLVGCATTKPMTLSPASAPATLPSQPAGDSDVKKPFMFNEAPLPAGYPKPGPVGRVIVKHYPASRMARVEQPAAKGGNDGDLFRPLFNHIKKEKIEMSTPVAMNYSTDTPGDPKPVAMAFVYATPDLGKPGVDGVVQVLDVPPATYVSIGVRGSYSAEHYQSALKVVDEFLRAHQSEYQRAGPPRYLGYNSPFVPWFLRFGEVQVPVTTLP